MFVPIAMSITISLQSHVKVVPGSSPTGNKLEISSVRDAADHYLDDTEVCMLCGDEQYLNPNIKECTCGESQYSNTFGLGECKECPGGTQSTGNRIGIYTCDCGDNWYIDLHTQQCAQCPEENPPLACRGISFQRRLLQVPDSIISVQDFQSTTNRQYSLHDAVCSHSRGIGISPASFQFRTVTQVGERCRELGETVCDRGNGRRFWKL